MLEIAVEKLQRRFIAQMENRSPPRMATSAAAPPGAMFRRRNSSRAAAPRPAPVARPLPRGRLRYALRAAACTAALHRAQAGGEETLGNRDAHPDRDDATQSCSSAQPPRRTLRRRSREKAAASRCACLQQQQVERRRTLRGDRAGAQAEGDRKPVEPGCGRFHLAGNARGAQEVAARVDMTMPPPREGAIGTPWRADATSISPIPDRSQQLVVRCTT